MKEYMAQRMRRLLPRVVARIIILILSMPYGNGEPDGCGRASQDPGRHDRRPSIQVSQLPSPVSAGTMTGQVTDVDVSTHYVAVYARSLASGWSIQPSVAEPRVFIRRDGSWKCRIGRTKKGDPLTALRVYLLPDACAPPLVTGKASLPSSLESSALARSEIPLNPEASSTD